MWCKRVSNFAPHEITVAPNKMKQRGEVAGKLPAVLCLSEKEEAASSSTRGGENAEAQRKGSAPCRGGGEKRSLEGKMENSATERRFIQSIL